MHGGDVWREGAPGDWLDFSANIRPGGPPDWVKDALLAGIGDVSYYPDPRMERARAALGAYLNLDPDWVLPTAGGISAIALAMRLDAPEVIAFGPCFSEYAEIAADCGAKMRELSLLSRREAAPEEPHCAAPLSAPSDGREQDKLTEIPCESPSSAPSSSALSDGRELNEQIAIPCGSTSFAASSSAPSDVHEPGKQTTMPCGSASSAPSSSASRDGRESSGLNAVPCGNESCAVPRARRKSDVSSTAPEDDFKSGEPFTASDGTASFSAMLPVRRVYCAADVRSPVQRDRHALAAPSEVLRGNMSPGAAVWLCNPLNPVGAAFPRAEIEALLRIVEAAGGWLVLDEAFVHCCPERTSVDLLARHPRLVIVGSLTKSLGIPGARVGYICANPELLRELARRQRSWELNCFAESVIRALPDHAAELRVEAAINAERREALRRELEALGAYVYPSEACFLLADFGREVAPIVRYLREKGMLVRQCADFHGIDDGRHLRLAVKDEAANARLIEALREALRLR